uniref:C2H2-type domain-containing protein n=1 Tax=Electrophorus electricus TaxID=8005 RepID=A0A4W4E2M3_ELEEL
MNSQIDAYTSKLPSLWFFVFSVSLSKMSKLETELMEVKSSSDGEAEVVAHEAVASVVAPGDAGPFAVPLKPAVRPLLLSPHLFNGNGEYVCSVCGESFFSLAQLAKHVQFHDRDRPFPCAVCGKRFLSRSHHTEHQRVHTGERPFPCNRCERAFTTHHNLKRHQLIHDKEEMYRCSVCGVLFCQEHQLGNIGDYEYAIYLEPIDYCI